MYAAKSEIYAHVYHFSLRVFFLAVSKHRHHKIPTPSHFHIATESLVVHPISQIPPLGKDGEVYHGGEFTLLEWRMGGLFCVKGDGSLLD